MKTALIATTCFKDYQIIRWHLMDMTISELLIIKENRAYSFINKFIEDNPKLPIQMFELHLNNHQLYDTEECVSMLDSIDRLVVFWNGKHEGISYIIQQAREMGKEVSVVFSYARSTLKFANAAEYC